MLPADTFRDRTVVITGGGTGLGRSMAEGLLRLGARVVICGRREVLLKQTAEELTAATGGEVLALPCDVRVPDQIEALLAGALERFGHVDGLVNNAAGNFICPTERLSHNAFKTVVDIVLGGTTNCTLILGKHWIAQKRPGVIVNIVATYAWTGSGYVVPSAVAKAGVLALSQSLAVEWGPHGIRSNAIAPGPFPTEGAWSRLMPPEVQQRLDPARHNPLRRVGRHEELVNLVTFLLSGYSAYINGDCITIDGGQWLHGAGMFNSLDELTDAEWDALQQKLRPAKPASTPNTKMPGAGS